MSAAIVGVPVRTSSLVPPGQIWLVAEQAIARSFMLPASLVREPSYIERVFRDCRRAIAATCPLTAPPEWAGLPSLWDDAFTMRALYDAPIRPPRGFLSVMTS